jgi:PAS domain S-box-containing protein
MTVDIGERKKAEDQPGYVAELQATLNVIPAHTWYASPSGGLTFVNKRTADYLGLPKDHPLRFGIDVGAQWDAHLPFVHPDDREETQENWSTRLRTGEGGEGSFRVRNAQGGYRWFLSRAEPLRASDGTILQWVGVNLDIDELKCAEQALRESEYKLRQIIDTIPAHVVRFQPDGAADFMNQTFSEFVGPGVGFDNLRSVVHPEDYPKRSRDWDTHVAAAEPYDIEMRLRRADGVYRWHRSRRVPLRDANGAIVNWYGAGHDVDDQKRAEQALRRSEAYLSESQRLSHTGTWVFNATTLAYVYWSDESYRIWGFDPLEGVPNRETIRQRIHPDDRDRVYEGGEEAVRQKRDYAVAYRIVLPDGAIKYLEANSRHLFSARGELVEVFGTHVDVTERQRAEQALRESEEKFRDYAETASDWYWETDPDHKFTRLTEDERLPARGFAPVSRIGLARWEFATDVESEPEKWELHRSMLEARQPFRDFVYRAARSDGSLVYIKINGKPIYDDAKGAFLGYRGTGTDMTAAMRAQKERERLRQLESDLAHMNRLSMMGELAASLAHEITQPIAAARNNARAAQNFLDMQPPDLGQVREALSCVVGDNDRAGDMIDRIRDHIKKAPPRKEQFDLNEAINEVIVLGRSAVIKNGVSVQTRLSEGLFPVHGDRVQLQQVVLNLLLNAVEAMGSTEARARELLISTEQDHRGVLVAVRDSGPGLDPSHLERVFDAFYTTKCSGMGMGLSICRSIIDAHGGRLWAEANEPRGAIFQFTLPAVP